MTEPEEYDPFRDLDWAMLEDWAGMKTLSLGRQYQRDGRVRDLVHSANGCAQHDANRASRHRAGVAARPP